MAATEVEAGQFKTLQTYEGNISSSALLFAERSQLGRAFGDKRDHGIVGSYTFSEPKDFASRVSLGVFNGMSDAINGKGNDPHALVKVKPAACERKMRRGNGGLSAIKAPSQ